MRKLIGISAASFLFAIAIGSPSVAQDLIVDSADTHALWHMEEVFPDLTVPDISDSRLLNNRTATAKQEQLARLAFRSGSVLAVGSSCLLRKRVTMKGTIEVMIHFGCLS